MREDELLNFITQFKKATAKMLIHLIRSGGLKRERVEARKASLEIERLCKYYRKTSILDDPRKQRNMAKQSAKPMVQATLENTASDKGSEAPIMEG